MEDELDFHQALEKILNGFKITRIEWKDKRHYGIMKDGMLQLHKAGESDKILHPWILSENDIIGLDWFSL